MIQRIQSIWLLLAATCAILTYKFTFFMGTNAKGIAGYKLKGTETFPLLLTTAAISAIVLVTIFLFRNRTLQLRLSILAILLECLLIFLYYNEIRSYVTGTGTLGLAAILHAGVLFFLGLACRGINKDEKLIRESDRLR